MYPKVFIAYNNTTTKNTGINDVSCGRQGEVGALERSKVAICILVSRACPQLVQLLMREETCEVNTRTIIDIHASFSY